MTSCAHQHVNGRACAGRLIPPAWRWCAIHRDAPERCPVCREMLDAFRPRKGWTRDQAAQLRAARHA